MFCIQLSIEADRLLLIPRNLDLVAFPSIAWAEVDYSVYTLRQASRRSWRIGQTAPVEVSFLVYEGTLQADALGLVAAKTRASLMVEGDLPEEGLAALEGDGSDVVLALARRLAETGHAEDQRHSLEALFAGARQSENEADEFIVDDEWDGETELDCEHIPLLVLHPAETLKPLGNLPLFAAATEPTALSTTASPEGRVMTFDQLALLLRRQKPRRKVVPEGQLALFSS
jgi:hypothetical protein